MNGRGADNQYKNRDDKRDTNRGLQVGQCNTQFSSDQFTYDTFNSIQFNVLSRTVL